MISERFHLRVHFRSLVTTTVLLAAGAATLVDCSSASSVGGTGGGGSNGTGGSGVTGRGGSQGASGGTVGTQQDAGADSGALGGGGGATSTGQGGSSGGSGGLSGTGGASGGCVVTVAMVSPPDPTQLEAYRGAVARVSASARGVAQPPATFVWTVSTVGQTIDPVATVAKDSAQSVIEFPVEKEGAYKINVRVANEPACGQAILDPVAQRAVFVVRATGAGFPPQEKAIALHGTGDQPLAMLIVEPGTPFNVAPQDADGNLLATYVRVSPPSSDLKVEGDTVHGPLSTSLISSTVYDVLIIPSKALAPVLFTGTPDGLRAQSQRIDAGIPIHFMVRDAASRPLAGVNAILRRGTLPSTVAASDASGAMTVLARPGVLAASFVPPAASGLPLASVGVNGAAGIALDQVAALDVQMTWDAVTAAPLTLTVNAPDGTTRVAGAQVRVTSLAAAAPVGTLVARVGTGPAVTLRAVGATDVDATTDANGVATFPALAPGMLSATVVPPAATSANAAAVGIVAVTSFPVTLTGSGLMRTLTLARKVSLSGLVLPVADSAGATVTAVDGSINAPGRVVTATVGIDGQYTLLLDPARTYRLSIDTVSGTAVARADLGTVTAGTADGSVADKILPAAHPVTGIANLALVGQPLANAHLQLFCPAWSAQCANPTFVLADVVTDAQGGFRLRLPEPPPR
jgi:hypothetical protein